MTEPVIVRGVEAAERVGRWIRSRREFRVEHLAEQGSLFGADVPVVRVVRGSIECIVLASAFEELMREIQVPLAFGNPWDSAPKA